MAAAVVGTSVTDDPKDASGSTDKEIEYVTHSTDKEFEYVKAKQFTSVKLFAKAGLGDKDLVTKTVQPYIARIEDEDDHDTEACEALFPVAWEGTRSIRMRELGEDGAAAQLDASSREVLLSTQEATASPDSNTPGGPDNAVFVADVEQGQAEEAPHRPPVLGDVVSGRRRGFNAERNTRMVDQLDQLTSAVGAAVGAEHQRYITTETLNRTSTHPLHRETRWNRTCGRFDGRSTGPDVRSTRPTGGSCSIRPAATR